MRRFITGTTTTYIRHYDDDADNDDDTNEYCNTATATRVHLLVLLVLKWLLLSCVLWLLASLGFFFFFNGMPGALV